ncbi:MAG: RusA family crossover junction endodeoxyribonuclease [Thermoguttaceae bacterium]
MKSVILKIPFPPSVNHIWKMARGRKIISKEYQAFQAAMLTSLKGKSTLLDRAETYAVTLIAFPSNRRRRDLDNLFKATFDALTKAGFWEDDCQVVEMHGYAGKPAVEAFAIVKISVYSSIEHKDEELTPEYWGEQTRKYSWNQPTTRRRRVSEE